jgi:hypothetical protein
VLRAMLRCVVLLLLHCYMPVPAAEPTTQPTVSGWNVAEHLEVYALRCMRYEPVPVSCQDC